MDTECGHFGRMSAIATIAVITTAATSTAITTTEAKTQIQKSGDDGYRSLCELALVIKAWNCFEPAVAGGSIGAVCCFQDVDKLCLVHSFDKASGIGSHVSAETADSLWSRSTLLKLKIQP